MQCSLNHHPTLNQLRKNSTENENEKKISRETKHQNPALTQSIRLSNLPIKMNWKRTDSGWIYATFFGYAFCHFLFRAHPHFSKQSKLESVAQELQTPNVPTSFPYSVTVSTIFSFSIVIQNLILASVVICELLLGETETHFCVKFKLKA